MSLVTFKDLSLDVNDPEVEGPFWADLLGLRLERPEHFDGVVLRGDRPQQSVWMAVVPEPHTVKNRVHLDVWARSLDDVPARTISEPGRFSWTTFADPEGNEFCVFTRPEPGRFRLKDLEVDARDHAAIAAWWAQVLGAEVHDDDGRYSYVSGVEGAPFEDIDFAPVPEPKTVKNRVHWDVTLRPDATIGQLLDLGATLVRAQDDEIAWTVLADPEGNEFCVFAAEE